MRSFETPRFRKPDVGNIVLFTAFTTHACMLVYEKGEREEKRTGVYLSYIDTTGVSPE